MKLAFLLFITSITGLLFAQTRPDLSNLNPNIQWGKEVKFGGGSMIDYFVGHDDTYIYFVIEGYGPFGITNKALSKVNRETLEVQTEKDMTHESMRFERAVMMKDKLYAIYRGTPSVHNRQNLVVLELDKNSLQPLDESTENLEDGISFINELMKDNQYTFSPDKRFMAVTLISRTSMIQTFNVSALVFDEQMNVVTNAEYKTEFRGSNYMDHNVGIDNKGNVLLTLQIDGIGAGKNKRDSKPPYGFRTFLFEPGADSPKMIDVATNDHFVGSFFTTVADNGSHYFVATYREDHSDNARGFLISKMENHVAGYNLINLYPFTDEFLTAISIRGEFLKSRGIDKLIMKNVQFLDDGSFVVGAEQSWERSNSTTRSGPLTIQYLDDDVVLAHFSSDYKMQWCSNISKKQRFYDLGRYGSYKYFNAGGKHLVIFNDALRNRDEYQRNKVKYTTNNLVGLFIGQIDDTGNFAKKPAFGEHFDGSTSGVVPKEIYFIDNKIYVFQTLRRTARVFSMTF